MNQTLEFLVRHGAAVLFAAVFVEPLGVPLPAAPWMLYAGCFIVLGVLFSDQLEQVIAAPASLGS